MHINHKEIDGPWPLFNTMGAQHIPLSISFVNKRKIYIILFMQKKDAINLAFLLQSMAICFTDCFLQNNEEKYWER